MIRTDDAGQWTMDAGPSAPYYKLTGELKMQNEQYEKAFTFGQPGFTMTLGLKQTLTILCIAGISLTLHPVSISKFQSCTTPLNK